MNPKTNPISKLKNTHFIIRGDIFPFDIMVSIEESDEKIVKIMSKYGYSRADCENALNMPGRGRCVMLAESQILIRLVLQPTRAELAGVIAHEALHAVVYTFDRMGMKFEAGISDEAYAYYLGWLIEQICKKMKL